MQEWIVEAWSRVEHGIPYVSYGLPNEEIIRCRDCKYARKEQPMRCYQFRFKDNGNYQGVNYVEPDGFCAWAERVD